jgi:hypothetical protein
VFKQFIGRQRARECEDWLRGEYNLNMRKPDLEERIIFWSAIAVFVFFLLIMLEGVVR